MLKFIKRKILERKYLKLITQLTISEKAVQMYVSRGLYEYAAIEEYFQEETSNKIVKLCIELNELRGPY